MPGRTTTLRPAPEPTEANDVAIVTGGTVLWFLGFLVLLPFHGALADDGRGWWVWTCLAGAGLGLIGIRYCRARRDAIHRSRTEDGTGGTGSTGGTGG